MTFLLSSFHILAYLDLFFFQLMIDRKLEPLVKRLMVKYLGEMEEEDLIMFVVEHLKDHKSPQKLIEGLEPVRHYFICQVSTSCSLTRTAYSS
jgi:hypothetical protein